MMSSAIQPPAPRVATYCSPEVGAPGRGSVMVSVTASPSAASVLEYAYFSAASNWAEFLTGGVTSS